MKEASHRLPIEMEHHPSLIKEGIFLVDGEVWSTQKRIAKLYGRSIPTVNDHLKKMIKERELIAHESEKVLVITQKEGKKMVTRNILVYSTEAVIAIGFSVKGKWGKAFRLWARSVVAQSFDPKEQIKEIIK